ncbi:UNVERIFIED_CONTAM: hypothetical protein HDU68_009647 [Siphonaria sp. JEL0065]|nr:hypothetical protein HDU68_009647 [Siphonaria sp. JEL0065]
MASAAVIPPSTTLGRRNQSVIKPVGAPPPASLNSTKLPFDATNSVAVAVTVPPPTLEQMLQLTDYLKARKGAPMGSGGIEGIQLKGETTEKIERKANSSSTPAPTAASYAPVPSSLYSNAFSVAAVPEPPTTAEYFDFLIDLPPSNPHPHPHASNPTTEEMLASSCAEPLSLNMNMNFDFNIAEFMASVSQQTQNNSQAFGLTSPKNSTNKASATSASAASTAAISDASLDDGDDNKHETIPSELFEQYNWINEATLAAAVAAQTGSGNGEQYDFYNQDPTFIDLFGHEMNANRMQEVVQMADLNRLVAPTPTPTLPIEEEVEEKEEIDQEFVEIKVEKREAKKKFGAKKEVEKEESAPTKRGRGRPRKLVSEKDAVVVASSAKKRKAEASIPSAPTRTIVASTINSSLMSEDDDDDMNYYMRMAEAATAIDNADSVKKSASDEPAPLLSRPLKLSQVESLSLHKFKPLRPMDPELAKQYLALKDPTLNSKERRQLRNKLSARSFRERRKEYIDTLEAELRRVVNENVAFQDQVANVNAERDMYKALVDDMQRQMGGLKLESCDTIMEESTSASPESAPESPKQQGSSSLSSSKQPKSKDCRPRNVRNFDNSISVHSVVIPDISIPVVPLAPTIPHTRQRIQQNNVLSWLQDQHNHHHFLQYDEIDFLKRINSYSYSTAEDSTVLRLLQCRQPSTTVNIPNEIHDHDDMDTLCGEEIHETPIALPIVPTLVATDFDDNDSLQGDELEVSLDPLTQLLESLNIGRLATNSEDSLLMRLMDGKV